MCVYKHESQDGVDISIRRKYWVNKFTGFNVIVLEKRCEMQSEEVGVTQIQRKEGTGFQASNGSNNQIHSMKG